MRQSLRWTISFFVVSLLTREPYAFTLATLSLPSPTGPRPFKVPPPSNLPWVPFTNNGRTVESITSLRSGQDATLESEPSLPGTIAKFVDKNFFQVGVCVAVLLAKFFPWVSRKKKIKHVHRHQCQMYLLEILVLIGYSCLVQARC